MKSNILSLFLLALPACVFSQALTCYEEKSCINANYRTTVHDVVDANHCLFECQATEDVPSGPGECTWWSYAGSKQECLLYTSECTLADTTTCPDCVTGERGCQPVYECGQPGQCEEAKIANVIQDVASESLCLKECDDQRQRYVDAGGEDQEAGEGEPGYVRTCNWYTYNPTTDEPVCYNFDGCPILRVEDCPTCLSGQVECATISTDANYNKLFIVNGYKEDGKMTEVIDLLDNAQCTMPAEFPIKINGAGAGYVGDQLIVCGGMDDSQNPIDDCYFYTADNDRWTKSTSVKLDDERGDVASVMMDSDTLWITGGYGKSDWLKSTEIYRASTGEFSPGEDLPRKSQEHCIVKVGEFEYIMLGGGDFSFSTEVHSINFGDANPSWKAKADMPEGKKGAFCGFVTNEDGERLVIVSAGWSGGPSRLTFVYDVDKDEWIDNNGPAYPLSAATNGMSIPYQGGFLATAGSDGTSSDAFDEHVFWFNPADFDYEEYKVNNQALSPVQHNHYFGSAFLVPDDLFCCGTGCGSSGTTTTTPEPVDDNDEIYIDPRLRNQLY